MDYKIAFTTLALQKIRLYIEKADGEISGLGKITNDRENERVLIEDVILLDQKNTGASTNIDQDSLAKFYDELMQKGEDTSHWKLWWHSHADMDVFWSGTDTSTIDDFDTEQDSNNFFVSVVGNKAGEFKCRIDVFRPVRIEVDDLEWVQVYDKGLEEEIEKEVKEKTSTPKSKYKQNYYDDLDNLDDGFDKERGSQYYQQGYIWDQHKMMWIPPKKTKRKNFVDGYFDDENDIEKLKQFYYMEWKENGKKPYTTKDIKDIEDFYEEGFKELFYHTKAGWFPRRPKNEVSGSKKKKKKLRKQVNQIKNHGLIFKKDNVSKK